VDVTSAIPKNQAQVPYFLHSASAQCAYFGEFLDIVGNSKGHDWTSFSIFHGFINSGDFSSQVTYLLYIDEVTNRVVLLYV
jgi:hypothetical protein